MDFIRAVSATFREGRNSRSAEDERVKRVMQGYRSNDRREKLQSFWAGGKIQTGRPTNLCTLPDTRMREIRANARDQGREPETWQVLQGRPGDCVMNEPRGRRVYIRDTPYVPTATLVDITPEPVKTDERRWYDMRDISGCKVGSGISYNPYQRQDDPSKSSNWGNGGQW